MAIEQKTIYLKEHITGEESVLAVFDKILSLCDWKPHSEVIRGEGLSSSYGKYYFTDNSYMKVWYKSYPRIDLVTPNGSKTVMASMSDVWTLSVGKTDKGFFLYIDLGSSEPNVLNYNIFVGEVTLSNGTTSQGCIYTANDGTLSIATDNGISTEPALGTTNSADRKAVLVPAVNTVTGDVFKDVFVMRYSPIQYGVMEIEGKGVYLCAKILCLKDSEGARK